MENAADCYMEVSAGGGDALRAKKLALIRGDQSWQSYPSAV